MYMDGLEDAYTPGKLMGSFAEDSARTYQFTREAQDEYALESLSRALEAIASGAFKAEITPVEVTGRKGVVTVTEDEQPGKAMPEKIPTLKPAFSKDGTITAANASSISDGASALVLMTAAEAAKRGLKPLAKIVAHATQSQDPSEFTIAPIGAMTNLHFCESCNKLRLTCDGKLRPCLGSHLEFDLLSVLRAGATDAESLKKSLQQIARASARATHTVNQLLALAHDIPTYKMHHGHRGLNHPVKNGKRLGPAKESIRSIQKVFHPYCKITKAGYGSEQMITE